MNILIPMAGAGSRFAQQGYDLPKSAIFVTSRHSGLQVPMVIAAVEDLPHRPEDRLIFVLRASFSQELTDLIKQYYPAAHFITVDKLTEGQASTCLLARKLIDNAEPLLIAACDNGMDLPQGTFDRLTGEADALIFTFRNADAVEAKPQAYGWIKTEGETATGVSIKIPLSSTPRNDHAVVGAFWFRYGADFVAAADAMIAANDRINNEFYADQAMRYIINAGLKTKVLETERYICWGTPEDYMAYEKTLSYWRSFAALEPDMK